MGQPSLTFWLRNQFWRLGGPSLKQRGLAGRRKGGSGAELGFQSNGLYRQGAVLSKKCARWPPMPLLTLLARSERPF